MYLWIMIYCVGETLYDIVFKDGKPVWGIPGGGMFNCALSLAHAGADVQLITELGNDTPGSYVKDTLIRSGVKQDYLNNSKHNTTLALGFLDELGNADYQFYKVYSEIAPVFAVPEFSNNDILVFGSLYSVDKRNRENIVRLAMAARNAGSVIMYDPNFRKSNAEKLPELVGFIKENISMADIVRGSDEDFKLMANADNSDQAYEFVKLAGCENLILTLNKNGVDFFTPNNDRIHFDALPTELVSTIGAGDAFNAGVAYQIHQLGRAPASIDEWRSAINNGLSFAAEVCASEVNYIKERHVSGNP